jgi:hypothetical protein
MNSGGCAGRMRDHAAAFVCGGPKTERPPRLRSEWKKGIFKNYLRATRALRVSLCSVTLFFERTNDTGRQSTFQMREACQCTQLA